MNTEQAAIIIRECIRQAAKECDCKPSEAHKPAVNSRAAVAARNIAIRLAYDQGIPIHVLAHAFGRSRDTISNALKMSVED